MSIESTLSELTLAIRELTVALAANKTTTAPQEAVEKPAGKPAKPTKPESAASTPPAASSAPTAATAPAATAAPAPTAGTSASTPPAVEYDRDIVPLFRQYAGKNRDAALAFIKGYKPAAGKLSDAITPAQYPEVLAKLKELLS